MGWRQRTSRALVRQPLSFFLRVSPASPAGAPARSARSGGREIKLSPNLVALLKAIGSPLSGQLFDDLQPESAQLHRPVGDLRLLSGSPRINHGDPQPTGLPD